MKPLFFLGCCAAAALLAGCASDPASTSSTPSSSKAAAAPTPPPSPVFEPGPSVRCDRNSKVCSYAGTASPGLTRLYFGDGAANALLRPPVDPTTGLAGPAPKVADPIFKPSAGSSCDTLVASCYDIDGANLDLTKQQFGSKAAQALGGRTQSNAPTRVARYGDTITCDYLSKVCYDRLGAGYGVTLLYLDDHPGAADRLLQRLANSPS